MPEGHDDFGRLVRVVSPDSSTTRYLYDESGNLIEKTDATGTVTAYEYDAMNRLVQVERADPNTALTSSERYIYDVCRAGSLCGVVDASGRTDYSYDGLGRLVVESRMQGDRAFVTAYFYDALGRMSAMIYPSGRTLTYAYQAADPSRLDSIGTVVDGDPVTVVDNITYDESGTIATYTLGNSSVVTRANNLSHELTALESTPVLDFGYQRDGVGNITQIADATIGTRNFGYDPQDRLTDLSWGASGPTGPELHWSYDKAGNRLTAITGATGPTALYVYTEDTNLLVGITGAVAKAFDYNERGDTIAHGDLTFAYDPAARVASISDGGGVLGTYEYDYRMRRVSKLTGESPTQDQRYFAFDASSQIIAEMQRCEGGSCPAGELFTLNEYIYLGGERIALIRGERTSGGSNVSTYSQAFGGAVVPDSYIAPGCVVAQDFDRDAWEVDSDGNVASGSFELSGNTWKTLRVAPMLLTVTSELRWAMNVDELGEMQAFGVGDGAGKQIIYVKYGSESWSDDHLIARGLNSAPVGSWQQFSEFVAADWDALYGEPAVIRELYFVNDADAGTAPTTRFDDIKITEVVELDVSNDTPAYTHSFETLPTLAAFVHPRVEVVSQDKAPSVSVDSDSTVGSYALDVDGNAWKTMAISPVSASDETHLRVDVKVADSGELQGIGVQNSGGDTLIIAVEETEPYIERWIWSVNGHHQASGTYATIDIPIGRAWKAVHGTSLTISKIVFVNNNDFPGSDGEVLFDDLRIYDKVEDTPSYTLPTFGEGIYYYHNDHLGTPVALTDDEQTVVWSTERDPWGNRSDESTTLADFAQPFDMPGQYRDEESGLSYNWNRTYDGGTGRFLQREPMLDDFMMLTAMNRGRKMYPGALAYSYAGDMPMTMVDPDGMEAGPNGPAPDFPFFPPPPPPDQCVNNPSELQQCLNACKAGGAAALRYCGTMPTPQLRVMCLSAVAAGTVSCMGFCWARFVD